RNSSQREARAMSRGTRLLGTIALLAAPLLVRAGDPNVTRRDLSEAAERGRQALLGRAYIPPTMTLRAYETVWKEWGLKEKPSAADYDRLFRERYGLHPAPYAHA